MTDLEYQKQLLYLSGKLARAASAKPYDPDAYNAVIAELTELGKKPNRSRRRQAWFRNASIVVLACVLAYGFYIVLQLLKM